MERVCFLLRVRADRLEEYRERHRDVWPGMLDALRDAGWSNYSLFLGDDGLLVGYLETDDFEAARRAMAQAEVNERWQRDMASFFEARADHALMRLEEVFHLA
jgi:L-rhamnose mutarotase